MKARAVAKLQFLSENHLQIAFNTLKPETDSPTTARSKTSLHKEGAFLVLEVEAQDTVALRAALNAYLRWTKSVGNVLSVLENSSSDCKPHFVKDYPNSGISQAKVLKILN